MAVSHTYQIISSADNLIYSLVRVNILMLLIYVSSFYGFSYFEFTFINFFHPSGKQVVLPAPLGPMTATIPLGGNIKFRSWNTALSPYTFATCFASITLFPTRPFGMKFPVFLPFPSHLHSTTYRKSSKQALPFAWS